MKYFEKTTRSFIVRIWLEPRELENAREEWRGVVEHVGSRPRQKHYFQNLEAIGPIISNYLENLEGQEDKEIS